MPSNTIAYLLKFAPREAYIDDLLNGHLYMNAAGYYHGLPGEQGDRLEASMVLPACIYGNYRLPIYSMYTVRENDIVDGSVQIPKRMIREFGCEDGWIGIVQYASFARLADRHTTDDGSIYAHGPVSYGVPGPKLIREIFEGIPHNLVIKTPKYAYQQEYRIIGSRPVECRLYQTRITLTAKLKNTTMWSLTWTAASQTFPGRSRCRASNKRMTASC